MTRYPHVAQRLFNTPLAITRNKAEVIVAALRDRLDIAQLVSGGAVIGPIDDYRKTVNPEENPEMLPSEVIEGVMVIRVSGSLANKWGTMQPFSGVTGYDGIRANYQLGLEDDSVRAIVLDIDSPGGEVAGCFDLVDMIHENRGTKPVWSILSENAYSAAYAIASASDRIIVPRTGGTGSVGVITLHTDFSKLLGNAGIKVTLIQYGERKAEGNEVQPLSDQARAAIQADIDTIGELFVDTVARNRKMPTAKVRATEAATFLGSAGVDIGFADAVMSPDEAFATLLRYLN
jgi:capsid assembly protease